MCRIGALLAALALSCAVLLGGASVSRADSAPGGPAAFTLPVSLDLHDGTVQKFGGTYYAYGTAYGCGFHWQQANTPFCGFKVSTAPSLRGPWSTPTLLFGPDEIDPFTGTSWQVECGGTGAGCFNARMIQRSGWGSDDGVWILWFNSPADFARDKTHAYNAMGCNGPAGPCGPSAGPPYGSYTKPSLKFCTGNGDMGFIDSVTPGAAPALVCTMGGALSLSIEELNGYGVGGSGVGAPSVAGLKNIESPGGWYDRSSGQYFLTYSDPGCGYCTGTGTGYATTQSLYGTWVAPPNLGFGQPANGRRLISANSCGGQARTVSVVDGQPWQAIDLWTGDRNEASAQMRFVPLNSTTPSGTPGDGQVWRPPLALAC